MEKRAAEDQFSVNHTATDDLTVASARFSNLLPLISAFVALIGLGDAIYLTLHHMTGEQVPCSLVSGCEMVLTSSYATIGGIPLAAFGAAAYFIAFSLAILTVFGNPKTWLLFGIQVILMAVFTIWLLYLQAFVINAFCQFCLLSALVTFTLLAIYLFSKFKRSR